MNARLHPALPSRTRTRTYLRTGLFVLLAMLAVLALACGDDDDNGTGVQATSPSGGQGGGSGATATRPAGQGGGGESSTRVEITAENLEFDKDELMLAANTEVTVVLDNQDAGVLHNISFYRSQQAQDDIHVGQLFPGVSTREETFRTPGPGSYFFRCDVHPDTMTGDLIVR